MSDLPKNETVKLVEGVQRVFHTPTIVEGTTSSTGKTILVERDGENYRLDTEDILSGNTVFRDGLKFKLYTPESMQKAQRANKNPGPVAGADRVMDEEDLPEPTHSVQ